MKGGVETWSQFVTQLNLCKDFRYSLDRKRDPRDWEGRKTDVEDKKEKKKLTRDSNPERINKMKKKKQQEDEKEPKKKKKNVVVFGQKTERWMEREEKSNEKRSEGLYFAPGTKERNKGRKNRETKKEREYSNKWVWHRKCVWERESEREMSED